MIDAPLSTKFFVIGAEHNAIRPSWRHNLIASQRDIRGEIERKQIVVAIKTDRPSMIIDVDVRDFRTIERR